MKDTLSMHQLPVFHLCNKKLKRVYKVGGGDLLVCFDHSKCQQSFMTDTFPLFKMSLKLSYSFYFQFFFTSFGARDRSYLSIFRLWQNALLDKVSVHTKGRYLVSQQLPSVYLNSVCELKSSFSFFWT